MKRLSFGVSPRFEVVRLVRERGVSIAQAARDLDVHETVLHRWAEQAVADPQHVRPG